MQQARVGVTGLAVVLACGLTGCGSGDDGSSKEAGAAGTISSGGSGSPSGGGNASGGVNNVADHCETKQAKLAYDSGIQQTYELSGWPSLHGGAMGLRHFGARLGTAGRYEVAFTPQLDPNAMFPQSILDTQPWPVQSALLADATAQTLGPLRCVAPGSGSTLARQGDQLLLDLKNVDVMAACGDRAVGGQINLCFQPGGCAVDFDGGSVDSTAWVLQPDTWVAGAGVWSVEFNDGSYLAARTTASTTGPAYWALIVTSASGPYGGEIYCASGGSVEQTEGSFGYTILHWTNLGKLSCGAGTGTVKGCLKGE